MEYKSTSYGFDESEDKSTFSGIAVRFGNDKDVDSYGDYFEPDSSTGLKEGTSRPFLMEHGNSPEYLSEVVGWAEFSLKEDGWHYTVDFLNTDLGQKARRAIQTRQYKTSTGATTVRRVYTEGYRVAKLKSWIIGETSAVLRPADKKTPLIKSFEDFINHSPDEVKSDLLAEMRKILAVWDSETEIAPLIQPVEISDEEYAKLIRTYNVN